MPGYLNRSVIPFGRGLNNNFDEFKIQDDEASDLLNCVISDQDTLEKRKGYTIEGNDTGSTKILGLHAHTESGGTNELVRSSGTDFQYLSGSTWTDVDTGFTTGLTTNYVTANDKTYIFNGTDNVHSYAGGGAALTDHTTNIPVGVCAAWFNRMLCVVKDSDNELYISALGDPEDFSDGYTLVFDNALTGVATLGHQLVVFEEKQVWVVTGYEPTQLSKDKADGRFGSINHRSIIQVAGTYLFFQDADGHIRVFNGSRVEEKPVSYPIDETIKVLKSSLLSDSAAGFFDNKYHLAVAGSSTSTINDTVLVYDVVAKAWTVFDGIQASCFTTFRSGGEDEFFFGEADADSKVYELYQGTSDNGSAINFYYTTKSFDNGEPQAEKKYRLFYLDIAASGNHDITIEYAVDGGSFAVLGKLNLDPGGLILGTSTLPTVLNSGGLVENNTLIIPNRGRYIKFRFSNNAASEEIKIFNAEYHYRRKRIRKRLQATV